MTVLTAIIGFIIGFAVVGGVITVLRFTLWLLGAFIGLIMGLLGGGRRRR